MNSKGLFFQLRLFIILYRQIKRLKIRSVRRRIISKYPKRTVGLAGFICRYPNYMSYNRDLKELIQSIYLIKQKMSIRIVNIFFKILRYSSLIVFSIAGIFPARRGCNPKSIGSVRD